MLGTLQGPLYNSDWLSEYMWEESKLLFLVPLHPLESRMEAWMQLTVYQEWRRAIDRHDEQDRPKQRSWFSPMDPGLGAVVIIHSLTTARGQPLNGRIGLITSWHTGVTGHNKPGRFQLLFRTHQRFDGASWKLRKSNISLLWWHLPGLRQPVNQPHPLMRRRGVHTPPKTGDLVRICNLPNAEAALFVHGAMVVLALPMPRRPLCHESAQASAMGARGSSWEANIWTFYGPDMERPAGRILFPPHCFQILTSSKQVAKTLRLWRGKEAALVGLENHLRLKSPDKKAVIPVRERGGEVTVGYEYNIQDPQPWHLTVEECTYIAILEAGPTDPEVAKQLGVSDKQRSLTGLYIATLLVQTFKAGTWVDISRDTAGRQVLVDRDTKIEVHLAPLPNLQLAGPDRLLEPHTNEYLSEISITAQRRAYPSHHGCEMEVYEGYCCNGTGRETLKRIVALHDEQYPGVTSSSFRLQACFLEVGRKGSVVNYLMHDFDVLRAAKPSEGTYHKEPSLGQIWAADVPVKSTSFWLSFGPSEDRFMSRQEMRFSKLREHRSLWCPRPAPLDQRPMIRDPIRLPLESISSIAFIKFIILTQEPHQSPKSRSMGFSAGPMVLVDIQMSDRATQTPGFSLAVEPYDQCHLRKDSTGQMRLMLVPLWSLREVQNELVVILGHLSLATPLTNTRLHIADILTIMAPSGDRMPGWIDQALEAEISETAHPFWLQLGPTQLPFQPARNAIQVLHTSMTRLINDRSRNDGLGQLLPPKICLTPPERRCYTIVGQIQARNREGQEKEATGPQTRAEYMMGTEWALVWKHPQGIDIREGPPLYGWILLVIPVHSLLARSKYILCEPKSASLQPIRDILPQLRGVNPRSRQYGGPNGRDRWMVDPTELTMPKVMKRYCRPREFDSHPAINTKHLIANILSMTELEPSRLQQLGTHPVLMGPMKELTDSCPT